MTIRRARAGDIPQIASLLRQVQDIHAKGRPDLFVEGARKYTDNEIAALLKDDNRPIFVYTEGDVLSGYIFCEIRERHDPSHTPIRTLYIDDLCVDESARRQGVGRALFEYAKAFAKEIGCYDLTLTVWACNPGARRFYEELGMQARSFFMETIL